MEYAWAHNMMEVLQDMEASSWPDGDCESLNLDESWRVRVASAQAYCIVRKRQTCQYEKVMAFLERIHSLLPTLVPSIKHMKIMFGLKTMVIMSVLREGIGLIDVVYKILQFFPSKLPQYQDHCSKREMFLMRKNQLDFKAFAQSLAMDKQKLQIYIQNLMKEQYGEHYAQKTEDRLLHYLRELDKALPEDTYIDKMLKKNSHMNKEEKLLLELITDDSTPIATTLKTLFHCDSASFNSSKHRAHKGRCLAPESSCAGSPKNHLQTTPGKTSTTNIKVSDTIMSDGTRKEQTAGLHVNSVKDWIEKQVDNMDMGEIPKITVHRANLSPHFCAKHQRWVKNILCECPMESSEEQQVLDNEISPPLFPSNTSSEDLTPSDLTPSGLTLPPDRQQSFPNPSESKDIFEEPKFVNKPSSEPVDMGPPSTPALSPVQPSVSTDAVLKVVLIPLTDFMKNKATSQTGMHQTQTSKPSISRLSRKYRQAKRHSQTQDLDSQMYNASEKVQVSTPITSAIEDNAATSHNTAPSSHSHSKAALNTTVTCTQVSPQPCLSLQSKSLQPCVVLRRLTIEECLQVTKGRFHPRQCDDMEHSNQVDSSFDVNFLYSSSSSDDEADDLDPEYRPARKTLFRWSLECDHKSN